MTNCTWVQQHYSWAKIKWWWITHLYHLKMVLTADDLQDWSVYNCEVHTMSSTWTRNPSSLIQSLWTVNTYYTTTVSISQLHLGYGILLTGCTPIFSSVSRQLIQYICKALQICSWPLALHHTWHSTLLIDQTSKFKWQSERLIMKIRNFSI